jgi:AraC family transcriptional regulator
MFTELKSPDALSDLIVEGAFLELLGRWFRGGSRQPSDAPSWMRRVNAFLQDSFCNAVSLNDVAQVAGVHPSHVAREFHRIYGMTVGDYIRKLRVEFVAERLIQPHKDTPSLTDLALCAGFSSHGSHVQARHRNDPHRVPESPRNYINPLIKAQFPERQGQPAGLASPPACRAAACLGSVAGVFCSATLSR